MSVRDGCLSGHVSPQARACGAPWVKGRTGAGLRQTALTRCHVRIYLHYLTDAGSPGAGHRPRPAGGGHVFYQKVAIIGHHGALGDLIAACGPDTLMALLEEGYLSFIYEPAMGAVATVDAGTRQERHTVCTVAAAQSDLQDVAETLLLKVMGKEGRSRRLARRLAAHAQQHSYDPDILEAARSDIRDARYLEDAASAVL